MNEYREVTKAEWYHFVIWYGKYIEDYQWIPMTICDAIIVKDAKGESIAQQDFGFDGKQEYHHYYVLKNWFDTWDQAPNKYNE
ncbi:hypothetical protein M2277_004962 [Paenibacillus sp. LBL]|uniref:hypothetical protein n=1 Tax=Paenibacillus sp. LBL TaxID=2940563 RepID=UPI0024756017|nr:hypothetical protein [Paenibacillus sp. LBL]MDH6674270.1 hypothetical protein [Paenibacillus sp. LBL]